MALWSVEKEKGVDGASEMGERRMKDERKGGGMEDRCIDVGCGTVWLSNMKVEVRRSWPKAGTACY